MDGTIFCLGSKWPPEKGDKAPELVRSSPTLDKTRIIFENLFRFNNSNNLGDDEWSKVWQGRGKAGQCQESKGRPGRLGFTYSGRLGPTGHLGLIYLVICFLATSDHTINSCRVAEVAQRACERE